MRLRVALSTPTDGSDATLPPELPAGASEGQLQGYDPETHSYAVRPRLESGEHGAELSIPAACCTLPEGAKAVVVGLQGGAPPAITCTRTQPARLAPPPDSLTSVRACEHMLGAQPLSTMARVRT